MNKILHTFCIICGLMTIATTARADDENAQSASVVARTDCTSIATQIAELSKITDADSDTVTKLSELQAKYRSDCSKTASGRRSSGRNTRAVAESVDAKVQAELTDAVTADETAAAENADADVVTEDVVETSTPEKTPEEIAALIEAGFCADGTEPNKYGCCTGEKFRDMGNLVFACCPEDGGDCYPPIK